MVDIEVVEVRTMSTEKRLASIDSNLSALSQRLTDHTEQDGINFARLIGQVSDLDGKLDELLLREASREGEQRGIRRSVVIVAGSLSLLISTSIAVAAILVN